MKNSLFVVRCSLFVVRCSLFVARCSLSAFAHLKFNPNLNLKFSILVLVLFLQSCREGIDLELDNTYKRLVVEAYFTNDTTKHLVKLSTTSDALNKEMVKYISKAEVTITDGFQTFMLYEDSIKKGHYYTDSIVYGIPGNTYTLNIRNVSIDGKRENYSATSKMKEHTAVDSIHIFYQSDNPSGRGWSINLFARDNGGGRNFYLIKLFKNGILLTDSAHKYTSISDNTGFEGGYYYGFPAYFLREERKDEKLKPGDIVTLEMDAITQDYYNFIMEYIQEYYPKVPVFSGPSANISTNIFPKDKAAGFFAVYSLSRKTKKY